MPRKTRDALCVLKDNLGIPRLRNGRQWYSTRMPGLISAAASRMACTRTAACSNVIAVCAPIAPLVVIPMWGTEYVGSSLCHGPGVVLVGHIRAGEHFPFVGLTDHIHLERVPHSRFLYFRPKHAVEQANGGEILDPVKAHFLELTQDDLLQI